MFTVSDVFWAYLTFYLTLRVGEKLSIRHRWLFCEVEKVNKGYLKVWGVGVSLLDNNQHYTYIEEDTRISMEIDDQWVPPGCYAPEIPT